MPAKGKGTSVIRISIPYGAIKSAEQFGMRILKLISIPYGAIKSRYNRSVLCTPRLFQFHMVRLKDIC